MMDLILDKSYTLSVALDGGALVATYPYDKPVQSGNTTMQKAALNTYSKINKRICFFRLYSFKNIDILTDFKHIRA